MRYTFTYWILLIFIFCGCDKEQNAIRVSLEVKSVGFDTFYLERVGLASEETVLIDSVSKKRFRDTLIFTMPSIDHRLYEIRSSGSPMKVYFINDSSSVSIQADYFIRDFAVSGSRASHTLKQFNDSQKVISLGMAMLTRAIEKAVKERKPKEVLDSLNEKLARQYQELSERYRSFADTVSNPSLFLFVFDKVEFGKDYQGLKKFMERNASRFPDFEPMQAQKQMVFDFVSIMEADLEIGQSLPLLILERFEGGNFSLAPENKILLVDFWSTWQESSTAFLLAKKKARQTFSKDKLAMVSIALDNDVENWRNQVRGQGLDWPQLIDDKMWQGKAVLAFKLDSLPYNFLFSREGRLIKKGIHQDSVVFEIRKALTF